MPTTITNTIGTGGGYDYSTISAWEAGTQGDLVAADEIRRGVIQQVGYYEELTAAFVVAGSTTDATRYRELTAAAGASFQDNIDTSVGPLKFDTTKGCAIKSANLSYTVHFDFQEPHFRTSRIQWELVNSSGMNFYYDNQKATDSIIFAHAGNVIDNLHGQNLVNCLVITRANGRFAHCHSNGGALNTTFVCPSDTGYTVDPLTRQAYSSGQQFTNCAFFGTAPGALNANFTYTNCATNRASPPSGVSNIAYDTSTGSGFENTVHATADFRIKSTSALREAGTSTGAPANDILGEARDTPPAIGAHEYITAGGPPTLTSPTGTATSSTTASGSVSTNQANGTLYRLASTNATELAATVKAAALTQAVTATGVQNVTFTGLTPGGTYYAHYVHTNAALEDSARVSSASFTTPVATMKVLGWVMA